MIDLNTFGDSPAAIILANIVIDKKYRTDKISRILNEFNKILVETNHIHVNTSINLISIIYNYYIDKCDIMIDDDEIKTFTKNVLSTTYKRWQFRKNTLQPKKNRKI